MGLENVEVVYIISWGVKMQGVYICDGHRLILSCVVSVKPKLQIPTAVSALVKSCDWLLEEKEGCSPILPRTLDEEKNGYVARHQLLYAL